MAKKNDWGDGLELPAERKRTAVPEAKAAEFTAPPSAPAKKASRLRRDTPGERVNAYLPPEIVLAMREVAFKERRSVSDVLTEAAQLWYQKRLKTKVQE